MKVTLREARIDDAEACGRICHDAFEGIAQRHGFPKDFPSRETGVAVARELISYPGIYGVVAEVDGRIAGSNFLDERSPIFGVGPITVDPGEQSGQLGRRLMESVLDRASQRGAAGVRLVQDTFNTASLALYTKLGFRARLTTAVMQGPAIAAPPADRVTRPADRMTRCATEADLGACNRLCSEIHGHDRGGELADAIGQGHAAVVERGGCITGYTTGINFFGHSVGGSNDDLKALIAAAPAFAGPGFHVPTGNDELMRWCFDHGLRVVKATTLMSLGLYNEPAGAFLPSILY
jgi:predicted N-acetyltransferase YhbS